MEMKPAPKKKEIRSPNASLTRDGTTIRRVCFSFRHEDLATEQNTTTSLLNYIFRIGKVESMNLQSYSVSTCGNVQFHQPEHAAKLLREPDLKFAGTIVRTWAAVSQPIRETHILDLNNHCLQKIFSYLDVKDIGSVAEANERFKTNAQSVFPIKYESFEHKMLPGSESEYLLKHFGQFIEKLDIDLKKPVDYSSHLELIAPHCTGTLEKMDLTNVVMKDAILEKFRPVLPHLRVLKLEDCELSSAFMEMLGGCRELNALGIFGSNGDWQFPQINFPILETLVCDHTSRSRHLVQFLERNLQLKHVVICTFRSTENIFGTIAKHLPHVESAKVDEGPFGPNAFRSLRRLYYMCHPGPSASFLMSRLAAAKVPLEHLVISNLSNENGNIFNICQMKSLKTLKLDGINCLNSSNLLRICTNLSELTDLYIDHNIFKLELNDFFSIIRNAPKLQRLKLDHFNRVPEIPEITYEVYDSLVKVLRERAVRTRLEIIIEAKFYEKISYVQTHPDVLIISSFKRRDCSDLPDVREYWPDLVN